MRPAYPRRANRDGQLEGFAWDTISEEAADVGLMLEELLRFAVLYFLAAVDSGRVARRITRSPHPQPAGTQS
jgi:hypothetical protein